MFHVNGYGRSDDFSKTTKQVSEKRKHAKSKPVCGPRNLFITPGGLGIEEDTSVQDTKQPVLPDRH